MSYNRQQIGHYDIYTNKILSFWPGKSTGTQFEMVSETIKPIKNYKNDTRKTKQQLKQVTGWYDERVIQ
jgi:hypothetical protein